MCGMLTEKLYWFFCYFHEHEA